MQVLKVFKSSKKLARPAYKQMLGNTILRTIFDANLYETLGVEFDASQDDI